MPLGKSRAKFHTTGALTSGKLLQVGTPFRGVRLFFEDAVAQEVGRFGKASLPGWLRPANYERDLAFRRVRFIMREKFRRIPAPEFFELLRELAGDAELPLRHELGARRQRFQDAIGRFEKHRGFLPLRGGAQLPFALAAFDRQKTAQTE